MGRHPQLRRVTSTFTAERRFATTLCWLRWPAVIVWLLAILLLHGLSGSLFKVTNDTASAYLPASAPSAKVALLQEAPHRAARSRPARLSWCSSVTEA